MKARKANLMRKGKFKPGMNLKDDIAQLFQAGNFKLSENFDFEKDCSQSSFSSSSSSNSSSSSSSSSEKMKSQDKRGNLNKFELKTS
jgi:hypothetical protein